MAKVIDTGLTTAGIRSNMFEALNGVTNKYPRFCMQVNSTLPTETYKWLGALPMPRRWTGPRQAGGIRTESYSLENYTYENTLHVNVDEIDDDQTGQIMIRARELGQTTGMYRDSLFYQTLSSGLTTSGYDGVAFFHSTHSSGDSGNQSNIISCAAATGTYPVVSECHRYFVSAYTKLANVKDDKGEFVIPDMTGLVLACSTAHYWAWRQAFNAGDVNNTNNIYASMAEIIPDPRIATTSWYLMKLNMPVKPFVFQLRKDMEFMAMDQPNSNGVFYNNELVYGTKERYRFGYAKWQYAVLGRWF